MKKTKQLKRAMRTALLVLLLSAVGKGKGYAQTSFMVDNLTYSINYGGTSVTVTGHVDGTSATGTLDIPRLVSYNGTSYVVTAIGNYAFSGCYGLTGSLTIPDCVTVIGSSAFKDCRGFTGNLTIPDGVASIGNEAFSGCISFTGNLIIPHSITIIQSSVFSNCFGFTGSLTIPNSVTTIKSNAFYHCAGLTDLVIPNSVTAIEGNPFEGCSVNTVIALNTIPPDISSSSFSQNPNVIQLIVPCGSKDNYEVSDWASYFNSVEEDCGFHIVIIDGSGSSGGNVSASVTSIEMGEEVQLTISPDEGMILASLIVSNANDPSQTIPLYPIGKSTSVYGFIMPPFDVVVTAVFEPSTSVDENKVVEVLIYPNPTNGQIKLEAEDLKHITINDMLGRTVYEGNVSGNEFIYDFAQHGDGIYLICIVTIDGVTVKKLMVAQ